MVKLKRKFKNLKSLTPRQPGCPQSGTEWGCRSCYPTLGALCAAAFTSSHPELTQAQFFFRALILSMLLSSPYQSRGLKRTPSPPNTSVIYTQMCCLSSRQHKQQQACFISLFTFYFSLFFFFLQLPWLDAVPAARSLERVRGAPRQLPIPTPSSSSPIFCFYHSFQLGTVI